MRRIVVSDTNCFIVLEKINKLELFKQFYEDVITTPEIAKEFGKQLPRWVSIQSAQSKVIQYELESKLDLGEASAIALGPEVGKCTLIREDLKAKRLAEELKLEYTGTLGLLVRAKKTGYIQSVKPLLIDLQKVGLHFSDEVSKGILQQSSER
jgi:predicted nucleic acid-binding protein